MGAIAEKPEIMGRSLIFVGLAEGIAIYGLIMSIMILVVKLIEISKLSIAIDNSIREISRLRKIYGNKRWRKLKGIAIVCFSDGMICEAESMV